MQELDKPSAWDILIHNTLHSDNGRFPLPWGNSFHYLIQLLVKVAFCCSRSQAWLSDGPWTRDHYFHDPRKSLPVLATEPKKYFIALN